MHSTGEAVVSAAVEAPRTVTLGWFLRRMLLAITILVVSVGSMAWLTYASIDPNLDAAEPQAEVPVSRFTSTEAQF